VVFALLAVIAVLSLFVYRYLRDRQAEKMAE